MAVVRHRIILMPALAGLAALAWLTLWAWSIGPWQRYLAHGDWLSMGPGALLCRAIPGGEIVVPALIHTAGWLLMIVAMMLPTTLPLLNQFGRMTSARSDGGRLIGLCVAGYVLAWTSFGLLAHGLDWIVHRAVAEVSWLVRYPWVPGAALVMVAGLFQFSSLKYRCLEQCRTPLSFIISHWRGLAPTREAFALGLHHGVYCVGCCWALMLLMFVIGTANIGWMLLLGAVMAIEKNLPWGRRLSAPLGYGLLASGAAIILTNL